MLYVNYNSIKKTDDFELSALKGPQLFTGQLFTSCSECEV